MRRTRRPDLLGFAVTLALSWSLAGPATAGSLPDFEELAVPVGKGAAEPALFVGPDRRLLMSWTEPSATGHAVRVSTFADSVWSEPATVVDTPDLLVNWADFASVAVLEDGTLAAHWLETTTARQFAYDVKLAVSQDGGLSWTRPVVPHLDNTASQHGFVTLVPGDDGFVAVWLDGRAYDGLLVEDGAIAGTMQLRTATVRTDGTATPDVPLDVSVCSCCQTDAALAGDDLLVVYRDRTAAEIRDISLVALRNGIWTPPQTIHDDGWEIGGCPVNGPSVSAREARVVVAWFTGAGDVPAVRIAFSDDAGRSFGAPVRIDRGNPAGRVDTLLLEDGTVLVSWIELTGSDETILVCRATAEGCAETREIAVNRANRSANFPRMAATPEGIYLAWTQPLDGGGDTIRMVRAAR